MKILYITDKFDFASHSFIDSVVNKYLRDYFNVDTLYWSKNSSFLKKESFYLLPYNKRNKIEKFLDLSSYDIIIVRNFFYVLKYLLKLKKNYNYKIGFQLSFPHSYRRYYQATIEKKAVIRKKIEFIIKNFIEKKLIYSCDFFFPISQEMINLFYNDISIPYFVLPLGIDEEFIYKKSPSSDILKMVYIGTIDKLRNFDYVLNHLSKYDNYSWRLDIYSKTVPNIPKNIENKIFFRGFLDRKKILKTLSKYDLGLFLIPEVKLYKVASPTKVMEYYQAGIPAVMSNITECKELFYPNLGFFMNFDKLDFKKVFQTDLKTIYKMGIDGQKKVIKYRNYKLLSNELYTFLKGHL